MLQITRIPPESFAMKKPASQKDTDLFDTSVAELEVLIESMEQENLSLEASLKAFETGLAITRRAQKALSEAEQKVLLLTEENGDISRTDFAESETEQ